MFKNFGLLEVSLYGYIFLSSSRPGEGRIDGLLPARGRTMSRWCQGQAVDQWGGVRPAGGMKVWVLIQAGGVTRESAVEAGVLKVGVV